MLRPEIAALSALMRTAEAQGLTVLVIGAFARELIVDLPYGGHPYRATRDVNAAVRVTSGGSGDPARQEPLMSPCTRSRRLRTE